jgi:hypothetical protein
VIGIDRYAAWPRLSNAVSDARGALEIFEQLGFALAAPPLLDEEASGPAIESLVNDELSKLSEEDRLVVFYAGHGHTVTRRLDNITVKTGFLIPVNAEGAEGRQSSWIRLDTWLSDVARLPPRHILVIVDACRSGIALGPTVTKWRDDAEQILGTLTELRTRRSRRIITSALDDQRAMDGGPVPGHSLFTGFLIEGLRRELSRRGRAYATGSELGLYLQREVSAYPASQQTPDFGTLEFDDRGELILPLLGYRPAEDKEPPASQPAPQPELAGGPSSPLARPPTGTTINIEPRKRPRSAAAVVAQLRRIQRSAQGNRARHGGYAAALGVAAAAIWIGYRAVHDSPRGDTPRAAELVRVHQAGDQGLAEAEAGLHGGDPPVGGDGVGREQDAGRVREDHLLHDHPRTGEFYIELMAPVPRGVTTCPSSALRSRIPGLPEVAKEAGLVGTLWQGNQGLCLELNARGVLLVYWGHRAEDITEGTWMSSGRYVDLAVKRRDDPTSPEFHWTAELDGRTMLARPAGSDTRTPIVLGKTSFADRKPTGCSSVDLTYISVSATSERAGSPFNADYIKLRIAEQIDLSSCYRQYRTAVAPHDYASWLLRHDDTGQITGVALKSATSVVGEPIPVRWFSGDATSACADDGTAVVRSEAPGYCENTLEGCVARALRLLRLGPTTLDTDPGDNASRFWYYGGKTELSLLGRTCRD